MPRLLCVFLLLVLGLNANQWPNPKSDLPFDTSIVRGTLPNGVTYLLRKNSEQAGRVSLRLLVAVGSLHEQENERGLAHFTEHMVFRGTHTHPGESLTNELQREGIGFGPDNTAFTNYDHTVYHLELPGTGEEQLRRGLEVFHEYANHVSFEPQYIERERGVILSEKATRDTPDYRHGRASVKFLWPESTHARREVIGIEEVIQSAPRETFVAFYDAWYRPERLAVVAAGDFEPEVMVKLIAEVFGEMKARGPARAAPADFAPPAASTPDVQILTDPAMVGISVNFQVPRRTHSSVETHADRVALLKRSMAFTLFQRRLNKITREVGDTLVAPSVNVGTALHGWETATFQASSRISSWKELVGAMEQEHRRVLQHGFSDAEISQARRLFVEFLDADVRTARARRNEFLVYQMVQSLLTGASVADPVVVRDELVETIMTSTAEDCRLAYRDAWGTEAPHVFVTGNVALEISPADIRQVLQGSRKVAVLPRQEKSATEFAYNYFGPEGKIARSRYEADLDVQLSQFENGVNVNFKPTSFAADTVDINIRISGGRLTLKKEQAGLDWLANWSFIQGGVRKHDPSELADILSGRSLNIQFQATNDAFLLSARCARRDLLLTMKLLTAYMTDPAFRPESLQPSRASYGSLYSELLSSPGGPIRATAERILYRGDQRWGIPTEQEYYRHDLKAVKAWLQPRLSEGAIEIAVVGDTQWTEVSAAIAKTVGALPKRRGATRLGKPPSVEKSPAEPIFYTVSPQLKQSAIAWIFPAPKVNTVHEERRARLLASALEERVRVRLREELGSAYAPDASFVLDEATPGCGYFLVYAEVDTQRTPEALDALKRELSDLLRNGFGDDEFNRIKAPFVRSRADDLRNNFYWTYTVLADAQQRPGRLAAARDRSADTASIQRSEIETLLRQNIDPKRGFLFVARPGETPRMAAR